MRSLPSLLFASALLSSVAPARGQTALEGRSIYPIAASSGVPTNTSLRVQFRGALFIEPDGGSDAALLLRSENGDLIVPGSIVGRALDFVSERATLATSPTSGYQGSTRDKGFELWTEPLELEPNTRYEIQTRVAGCAEDETVLSCKTDEYRTIAEFDTGSGPDAAAPLARRVGSIEQGSSACEWLATFEGEDETAPPEALRFVQEASDASSLSDMGAGPVVALTAAGSPAADETTRVIVQVRALDPSGNLSDPVPVELQSCPGFDLSVLGCDTGPPGCPEAGSDEGCSLSPPGESARRDIGPGALALLLLSVACWRRRPRAGREAPLSLRVRLALRAISGARPAPRETERRALPPCRQ